jgi:hypothetical protein
MGEFLSDVEQSKVRIALKLTHNGMHMVNLRVEQVGENVDFGAMAQVGSEIEFGKIWD